MDAVPFIGPSYSGRSENLNGQVCKNWYVEVDQVGGKNSVALYPTPGLLKLAAVGDGPIRCTKPYGALLAVISKDKLYTYNPADGTSTLIGSLTTTSGPVGMEVNAASPQELFLADGAFTYAFNGTSLVKTSPVSVTASHAAFLDNRVIFNEVGSGRIYWTELGSPTVNALNFATAESSPDDLQGIIVSNQQLWLFGKRSTEVWYSTGNANTPFSRVDGAVSEWGCAAPASIAKVDSSVFWLATSPSGQGIVKRSNGYQAVTVSNPALEYQIGTYGEITDAVAYTYVEEGHVFYVLTFPDAHKTWVYDATTGFWHERESQDQGRHIGNCHSFLDGIHYVGDYRNGNLYQMAMRFGDDNGEPISRVRDGHYIHSDRTRIFHHALEIDFETGTAAQGADEPQAMLTWSDDNGRTWSSEQWRGLGAVGEYDKRAIWRRLGQSRQRIYRLTIADTARTAVIGAFLRGDLGD